MFSGGGGMEEVPHFCWHKSVPADSNNVITLGEQCRTASNLNDMLKVQHKFTTRASVIYCRIQLKKIKITTLWRGLKRFWHIELWCCPWNKEWEQAIIRLLAVQQVTGCNSFHPCRRREQQCGLFSPLYFMKFQLRCPPLLTEIS